MNQHLQLLNQRAAQQGVPLNGTFELTARCNLHCRMCYIHCPSYLDKQAQPLAVPFWLSMAEQVKAAGTLVLVITGGETFLYPHTEELLEKLLEMGFLISLNTNGTLLDTRRVAWLKEHRPTKINITLYGASDETYGKLCGLPDGFSRVRAAIDGLLEDGQNVYLNCTVVPENVGDLPAMAEFAKQRGLVLHTTSFIFPPGRYGVHTSPSRLTPEEAARADLLAERLEIGQEAQLEKCRQQAALMQATLAGKVPLGGGFHSGDGCSRSNCGGGRNSFAISWDGRLMICVTNSGIAIPLEGRTFADAWQELRQRVDGLPLPNDCVRCPYQKFCNACSATIYNETGHYDRLADYPCHYVRAKFEARMELLREQGMLQQGE